MRIVTIGGYGFDQSSFIEVLKQRKVDTFVDIRQRRGVRGHQYAFLNSLRLQALLAEAGIRYVYLPRLAPTARIRQIQSHRDEQTGVAKRKRTVLTEAFVKAFDSEILSTFDNSDFSAAVGRDADVVAIFCV